MNYVATELHLPGILSEAHYQIIEELQ